MNNLTWSKEAGENLVEIEEFIARDSLERAARFVDALIDHAEAILADNPRSGRTVPEIGNPDHYCPVNFDCTAVTI